MSAVLAVVHDEKPGSGISVRTGGDSPRPNGVTFSGASIHTLASVGVPAGKDVTLEVWSAGGGGGGGSGTVAGAGGGPGTYVALMIPAGLFALGGSVVLGAVGAAGATTADGGDGVDSTLTVNAILRATVGAGKKGHTASGLPGVNGTTTIDPSVTTLAVRPGTVGPAVDSAVGGKGGHCGGPGGGAGGAGGNGVVAGAVGGTPGGGGGGGSATPSAGGAGGPPKCRFSW